MMRGEMVRIDPETSAPSETPADGINLRLLVSRALPGSPQTSRALAETAQLKQASAGETIMRQGDPIVLTLMIRGHAGWRRTTADGQEVFVGVASAGEMRGITSLAGVISTVDLVAITDCLIAQWPGQEVRRLAERDPQLALEVIDTLSEFLNILTEKVDGFLHQGARRRVLRILARHRDLFFADPPILTRAHLHHLVGTSREMTGRVLRQLEREGTIARHGRMGLRLLRPEQLFEDENA